MKKLSLDDSNVSPELEIKDEIKVHENIEMYRPGFNIGPMKYLPVFTKNSLEAI